ncbi:uracil-DNA glycosylase family protein [Halorubrum gandharaense]
MTPDCDRYVPGYGDANADFHVVGDHPGVHGGLADGIPFTGEEWSTTFLSALAEARLLESAAGVIEARAATNGAGNVDAVDDGTVTNATEAGRDGEPLMAGSTFLSYLHMCALDGGRTPTDAEYDDMDRFFDAELRAIAAHVLLPVGATATDRVLRTYTAQAWKTEVDMDALHAEEIRGSGWLVVPIKHPGDWADGDAERLVESLRELQSTDFRRETDLGRFIAGNDPYLVR